MEPTVIVSFFAIMSPSDIRFVLRSVGLPLASATEERGRVYRIAAAEQA